MMDNQNADEEIIITQGFHPDEHSCVAGLFWNAFQSKLWPIMRPEAKAQTFIEAALNPAFALAARNKHGALLGVAGFKTASGALVGGGLQDLAKVYGALGAIWRGGLLGLLERDLNEDVLLMDGIFVAQNARGMGVGTALLRAIKREALLRGLHAVRLDVIDTNPRARALYEREGFVATGIEHLGVLRHLFGFRSATKMICVVAA
ncbi:GNAT family N-acetyltransferase [Shimia sp. SDUM112013]|uniref:GNAT family N-acetyltransferase n=1 Tax=Shimia sp. SDUM112013 TaxID=3136160 RepID=UPI0032EF4348